MTTACPFDGNLRTVIHRDRYSVVYRCSWCRQHSEEVFEPDPGNDLQREWGN